MSWFAEVMDQAAKRELKNMHRFYYWVKENYPEAMEKWLKEEETRRASDIRWWI